MPHIFYKSYELSLNTQIEILNKAKEISTSWHVDILKSVYRETIEMTFEDIMSKFDKKCHFVIIKREEPSIKLTRYGEIGFSTMGKGLDYFLWIFLTEEDLDNLLREYNLEVL